MTASFTLREMRPEDGPGLRTLMENDPDTGGMSLTTRFLVDPYQAWITLKPNMIGVVAETPGSSELAGSATVAFEDIQFEGDVLPSASLGNLKVRHDLRGQGLGARLAQWRVDRARERFGEAGVIITGTTSDNTASLATMKKWARQFSHPITIVPGPTRDDAPIAPDGLTARLAEARDYAEIAERSNHFYADYNLYQVLSAEKLDTMLGAAAGLYHYAVVVDERGTILAGALVCERAKVLYDEFRGVPPALRDSVPPDNRLRLLEVGSLWFDEVAAGKYLWEFIGYAFRDRVNSVSTYFDPRGALNDVLQIPPGSFTLDVILAVNGPVALGSERLVAGGLRG